VTGMNVAQLRRNRVSLWIKVDVSEPYVLVCDQHGSERAFWNYEEAYRAILEPNAAATFCAACKTIDEREAS
jgi:hypothetical protein